MREFKNAWTLFIILLAAGQLIHAQSLPIPEGRRLRDIVAYKYPDGKLLIGATTGAWAFNDPTGQIMDREYSYVTPENDFKHSVIRGNPNAWNWSRADAWLQHIIDNGQVLRMHGPIAPQCSGWAKNDDRTAEELAQELDTFMTALCMRYNGVEGIEYLDVVNEIALSDGSWFGPKPGTDQWENPWFLIGQDDDPNQTPLYVKQAFAIANEHAPDLKLILNNHCHPGSAGMQQVKQTIEYLLDSGYRVDGLGWQGHVDVGWATEANLQALRNDIDWCQARNLEFHITEFDAWLTNPWTQTLEGQAHTYKAILDVLLEKLDSLPIGFNSWHVTDASGWHPERIPSLFDDEYYPKPAYYSYQFALEARGDYTTPYDVTVRVKHIETGEDIEGCEIKLNGETKLTGINGEITFNSITANWYDLEVNKDHLSTEVLENISIFSDTSFTVLLGPIMYVVRYHLVDAYSGHNIPGVEITIDSLVRTTDLNGLAEFSFPSGTYASSFHKTDFKNLESVDTIRSSKTLTIKLEKTHAKIKFRLRNGEIPVTNAMVILDNDTIYTNAVGTYTFESMPTGSSYNYLISKENHKPANGAFILKTDTTINIQLPKSVAIVEFMLDPATGPQNAIVILDNDSTWFSAERIGKFYNVPVDQEYTFRVISDNYPEYTGQIFLEKDTTVTVLLSSSNIQVEDLPQDILIYPNPATDHIWIQSGADFNFLEIYNSSGIPVMQFRPEASPCQISISELIAGFYWIRFSEPGKKSWLIKPFIIQ